MSEASLSQIEPVRARPSPRRRAPSFPLVGFERLLILLVALFIVASLAGMAVRSVGDGNFWFCLFGVSCLLVVPLLVSGLTGMLDPFEPILIVNVAYFLYFVYGPAKDHLLGRDVFVGRDVLPLFPRGMLYLAIGLVSLLAGYYSAMGRGLGRTFRKPGVMRESAVYYAWIAGAVGLVCFGLYIKVAKVSWIYFLSLGQAASGEGNIFTGADDNPAFGYLMGGIDFLPAVLLIWYAATRTGRKWNIAGYVLLLIVYTTIGFRFRILILALAPVIYYYLKRNRRPQLILLVVPAIAGSMLIGVIGEQRAHFRTGTQVDLEAINVEDARMTFQNDLSIYQPFLAVVDAFPRDHDYTYGSSFAYVLVHPIPRVLWKNKPEPPIYEIIRGAFGGDNVFLQIGVAYPNIGEYYANFGLPGIVIGMMLFGVGLRALYEYLRLHSENDWVRIIYALALPFLVQVVSRGYFVAIFQQTCFFFGPAIFGMWALRRSALRSARRAMMHRAAAAS